MKWRVIPESALDFTLHCRCVECRADFSVDYDAGLRDWPKSVTRVVCPKCAHEHDGAVIVYDCVRAMVDRCPCGYARCPNDHEFVKMPGEDEVACVEFVDVGFLRALRRQRGEAFRSALLVEMERP